MRVAIVHDALVQAGGAERVVAALHRLFPDAPIFTSAYLANVLPDEFRRMSIRTSFMQKLPFLDTQFRRYLLLYPLAFSRFDLSDYDVIVSSSAGWAHAVATRPHQVHICYCHTPARWLWVTDQYLSRMRMSAASRTALRPILRILRVWDRRMSRRPDLYVANSRYTAERIRRCYGRSAPVIYPPVETERFRQAAGQEPSDYYLVVSRLLPYKRIDLAVAAFTELGLPLKIAGTGPDLKALQAIAGPNVEFLGHVPDSALPELMARCKALIFPGEEDFGITPVEAMAAGRPVIAFARGGAAETVIDGTTGVLMREQSVAALREAVCRLESLNFDSQVIQQHARQFDTEVFMSKLFALVQDHAPKPLRHADSRL